MNLSGVSAGPVLRGLTGRFGASGLRLLIITGVLLISTLAPFVVSGRQAILLTAALAALGVGMIFMRSPQFGLVALIVTALIVPSPALPGGLNFAVLLLLGLVGLWVMDMVVRQRNIHLLDSRPAKPLLLLIAISGLSFIVGQMAWFPTAPHAPLDSQIGGLMIFVLSAGAFLLVAHQTDLRWLARMVWVYLALASLFIAGWLVPGVSIITSRLFQNGATANSMFWLWIVALAMSQAMFNQHLDRVTRVLLWTLVIATLYVAFVRSGDWKSGYLPAFVAVAVLVALRSWRAVLLMALVGPVLAIYLSTQAITSDEYSYSTRLDALIIVLNMVKANPIFGFGPANYYWYTPLFPIRGFRVSFNSHNQYVDIVAQTGILGLAAYFWFFGEVALLAWRLCRSAPAGFARAYVHGALAGIAGMIAAGVLVDWVLPFVYNIGLNGYRGSMLGWLFLGGVVSIERLVLTQAQEEPLR